MRYLYKLVLAVMLCLSSTLSNASIIFSFDISDTSWAGYTTTPTFGTGDLLTVRFADSANLNALTNLDLIEWDWFINSTHYSQSGGFNFGSASSVSNFFNYNSGSLGFTVGLTGNSDYIRTQTSVFGAQVGQTVFGSGNSNISFTEYNPYTNLQAHTFVQKHEFVAQVSEPSVLPLLGLGLLGLIFARKRKA